MELFWIILGFILHEGLHLFLAIGGVAIFGKMLHNHKCCHHDTVEQENKENREGRKNG